LLFFIIAYTTLNKLFAVFYILYCIPPLAGKLEQQRFTVRSGVLTSISSMQRSAISGRVLRERTQHTYTCLLA